MFAVIRARRSSLPVGIPKLPRVRQRELMNFSFIELEAATHNFATTIGQGGSGTVYKVSPNSNLASWFARVGSNSVLDHVS